MKLVRSHEEGKLRRLIASPAFARANIFDDDLAAIKVQKSCLVLNRLVNVAISILNLSKHLMYDFYYNQLKAQYGESCQLLYMDTDSLLLEIETEDVYKDMAQKRELYTSDYPQDHRLYSSANKKVLGKLKDECAGRLIAEYVGLLFEAKRALMTLEGFLLLSRVTSSFRTATTEGNRFTHSVDRSPEGSRISWAYWSPNRRLASVRLKRSTMPWSLLMSTRPRRTWTECFANSWLTEPMTLPEGASATVRGSACKSEQGHRRPLPKSC